MGSDGSPAPVALFAHRRPDHLRRVLDALAAHPMAGATDLVAFADGPRGPQDLEGVARVREALASAKGFRSVRVVERPANLGLARNIVQGVTEVLAERGRAIVVEDDIVVSPHFLPFMNEALDLYAEEPRVASVHGYVYPVDRPLPETFFLRGADCWGWATWSRAWERFEPDGAILLEQLSERRLERAFSLDGASPHLGMLQDQIAGRNDSWAVRWHASAFLAGMFTLYPGRSLVRNIGNDASGTHCGETRGYDAPVSEQPIRLERLEPVESDEGRRAFADFFRRDASPRGPVARLLRRLRRALEAR